MYNSIFIYLTSSVINRAIPFFILPVLTRYLTPYEYGTLAIFQVFLTFMTPLADLNISQNIARKYFKLNKEELAKYIANMLMVLFSSFSIVMILTAAIVLLTDNILDIPDKWLMVAPLIAFLNMVNKCNLMLFIQKKQPLQFGMFEIGGAVINMTTSLILVIVYNMGWEGRASGMLVTSIVLGILGFGFMWKAGHVQYSINKASIREILKISLPTIPHVLGIVAITLSDRIFIDWLIGKSAVGLYDVGYKIGMITMLFSDAFMKSWSPWFFKNVSSESEDIKIVMVRRSYMFMIGIIILACLLTFGMHLIFPYFVDSRFIEAKQFIFWIALAYAIRGTYQIMQPYILHKGRMNFLAINTFVAVAVNLIMNYYLINQNGAIGAAQASVIAFISMSLGTWWYAHRIHRMPWFSFTKIFNGGRS